MKHALFMLLAAVSLSGCQAWWCGERCHNEARQSSSLVGFLYPTFGAPPPQNSIPQLNLPVRVGLAFLPSQLPGGEAPGLEAARREQLLARIQKRFADRKFVREIVIVPDYYLRGAGGFGSLAGVQRLYGVDVMALVSYDQVTYRNDNRWSLGYMTIVGAYMLKGTKHDVLTLMDLAVVDPMSRSILLRAGGTDERHGTTTLVDNQAESRRAQFDSYGAATDALIDNFDAALTRFEADVRNGKANVHIANGSANRAGGGGAMGFSALFVLALVLTLRYSEAATLRLRQVGSWLEIRCD